MTGCLTPERWTLRLPFRAGSLGQRTLSLLHILLFSTVSPSVREPGPLFLVLDFFFLKLRLLDILPSLCAVELLLLEAPSS